MRPQEFTSDDGATRGFHATLIGACLLVWAVLPFMMFALGHVGASEVGLLVNNLTGTITVYPQSGTYLYNALTSDLHLLDKQEQTIEMTADPARGTTADDDHVRIKTKDGSDVNADVTVNYQLDPALAEVVMRESGTEDNYKAKWVRDYSRSVCRNVLGQMDTEDFYQANLRSKMADQARQELNERLGPHGIIVRSVQVQSFAFYEEYEAKIKEKKLADQEVEEQKSQERAAQEDKIRRSVEAEKIKDIEIAKFEGEMNKAMLEIDAEAERERQSSDAYAYATTQAAEAEYYMLERQAQAIRAEKESEAKGLRRLCEALTGEGGRNLVLLEYARKLGDVQLNGQPYVIQNRVEKVQHMGVVPTKGNASPDGGDGR